MNKLIQAYDEISAVITPTAIRASLLEPDDGNYILKQVETNLKRLINKYSKEPFKITVEDMNSFTNRDLDKARFTRGQKIDNTNKVMYKIPTSLYVILPTDLIVYAGDDVSFSTPCKLSDVISKYHGTYNNPGYCILVEDDANQNPIIDIVNKIPNYKDSDSFYHGTEEPEGLIITTKDNSITVTVTYLVNDFYPTTLSREIPLPENMGLLRLSDYIILPRQIESFINTLPDPSAYNFIFNWWVEQYMNLVENRIKF